MIDFDIKEFKPVTNAGRGSLISLSRIGALSLAPELTQSYKKCDVLVHDEKKLLLIKLTNDGKQSITQSGTYRKTIHVSKALSLMNIRLENLITPEFKTEKNYIIIDLARWATKK